MAYLTTNDVTLLKGVVNGLTLTVSASTKRSPAVSGSKRGDPTTFIGSLQVAPLQPAAKELTERLGLETPHNLFMTATDASNDVQSGDVLVIGTVNYPVKWAGPWQWGSVALSRMLIVEGLQTV